jgi:hypothetical protein
MSCIIIDRKIRPIQFTFHSQVLLGHVLEGVGEALLAEGKLAHGPDLGVLTVHLSVHVQYVHYVCSPTYRLQVLLDLGVESTGLQSDDRGSSLGVVGDGRATLGAEDAVDGLSGAAIAGVGLGGTGDSQRVLGDDGDQSW